MQPKITWQPLLLLALLIYFPLFLRLDSLVIQLWDESRLAINAYEMYQNGNYLVTYFEGKPDMWNTKPPLMIWLQTITMHLLGPTTLSVRLPAALAALATVGLLLWFAVRHLKSFWFGAISILVLLTSEGYVMLHGTRTGDYDSLLTLFTTAYLLTFFLYTEHLDQQKYLHYFFVALGLALFTKGISACFFLPALAIYVVGRRQLWHFLREKWLYIDLLLCFGAIAAYYFLREQYNPGYWEAVGENELWGRFGKTIEEHKQPFHFYILNWTKQNFVYWYALLPAGILLGSSLKSDLPRRLTIFGTLCWVLYMLVISMAQTKLTWYDMPVFPLMAMAVATILFWIFEYLRTLPTIPMPLKRAYLPYVFLIAVFTIPYKSIVTNVCFGSEPDWASYEYEANYYLVKKAAKSNVAQWKVLSDAYAPHLNFYIQTLGNSQKTFVRQYDAQNLTANDHVIVRQDHIKAQLEAMYEHEVIDTYKNAKIYRIIARKNAVMTP
jgi:4-amino-4-deoxy-L-arabinose transferase-like glycosyltransferase